MTDHEQSRPKFTIRRLSPEEAERSRRQTAPKPKPANDFSQTDTDAGLPKTPVEEKAIKGRGQKAKPKAPQAGEPSPIRVPEAVTGGRFRSAGAVLAFLGSALGSGLADEAAVRRAPKGSWWAEVAVPHARIAPLVWTAGGRPYARHHQQWASLSVSGELPLSEDSVEPLPADQWPVVELGELLAQTHLMPCRYTGSPELEVIVPGALGRWVLRRATALGLEVLVTPSLRIPLNLSDGQKSGVLHMRLAARHRDRDIVPAALVHSLTRLPHVMVAQSFADENLLVDVRCRIPLSSNLVSGMIPADEIWLLGLPESGSWRLYPVGETVNGDALLDTPDIAVMDGFPSEVTVLPQTGKPGPIPVRLIPRSGAGKRVDAVLLDDTELGWVRPLLMGKPIGEITFLIPGPGCHLLTAPGGLPGGGVPLGVPLVRVGPGGFYIEMGTDFYPPLPDGARQAAFQLDEESAVAVVKDKAYRFEVGDMIPAWSLWVGNAPAVEGGLSVQSKMMLSKISGLIRRAEAKQAQPPRRPHRKVSRSERIRLLKRAQKEEMKGNLVLAAEMLEQGGYPGPAGRLYERAVR